MLKLRVKLPIRLAARVARLPEEMFSVLSYVEKAQGLEVRSASPNNRDLMGRCRILEDRGYLTIEKVSDSWSKLSLTASGQALVDRD